MPNEFIKHYGEDHQLGKLAEECIELIIALIFSKKISLWSVIKLIWVKRNSHNYKEEMADVDNIISQFDEHWADGKLYCIKFTKRERQRARMLASKKN